MKNSAQQGVSEDYVNLIPKMYLGADTRARNDIGKSDSFKIGIGVHQGTALSPILFTTLRRGKNKWKNGRCSMEASVGGCISRR